MTINTDISHQSHSIYSLMGQLLANEFRLGVLEAENSRLKIELEYYDKHFTEVSNKNLTEIKDNLIKSSQNIKNFVNTL